MSAESNINTLLEAKASHVISEPIIKISHLVKSFGKNEVLKDFNLTLHRGENMVVLGRSGCGKSVLIKCIVGLLKYDAGSIQVYGGEVNKLNQKQLDELRAKIGFVFQSSALYDSMTVGENLEFALRRHGKKLSKPEIHDLVKETLDNVGLYHALNLMPSELSGGMRKRIGLARSLVLKPEIMLYDEPTTGLDPVTSDEISALILEVQKKYKTTSIIITHDIACAKTTGNRIVMLKDGEMYKEGSLPEFETSTDPEIHSFFK